MNLVEEFDRVRNTFSELGQIGERFDSVTGEEVFDDAVIVGDTPSTSYDLPSLTIEVTIRQAARGRGQVVAAACAAESILLATSKGYLLRYIWDEFGNERVIETELTRQPDSRVRGLFVDPGGTHNIINIKSNTVVETQYLHKRWQKPRTLSKLKGVVVTAVGWQKQVAAAASGAGGDDDGGGSEAGGSSSQHKGGAQSEVSGSEQQLEHTTGDILIGTEAGSLHTLHIEEKSKKEGPFTLLLDFKDRRKAICSVEQEVLPNGRRVVLVATPGSLYIAAGGPSLEAVFARYHTGGVPFEPLIEVDVPSLHSQLHLFQGSDVAALPSRFAWLVGGTICHGHLLLSQYAADASINEAAEYVGDMRQLMLGEGTSTSPEDEPTSMVYTEYHYVLLHADKLAALNQVSGKLVHDVPFTHGLSTSVVGTPLGVMKDVSNGNVYLYSTEALHEVGIRNEGKDMWRIYMDYQDYDNALKLCSGPGQRDTVYHTMALAAASNGDYKTAAAQYAKIVGGKPTFEDLALQLVDAGDPEALQIFLATKLQVLGSNDKAQSTMVAAWLTELYLDQINRALLESAGEHSEAYKQHEQQLRDFLVTYVDVLDVNTTTHLLATYSRLDELQHYAQARGDHESLLEYLMQRPDGAIRALGVLRKPSVSTELVYKFAPAMVSQATSETIDFWIACRDKLDPRRLLPALMRFGEPGSAADKREQVLMYISYAIDHLQCEDSAIHNLAVALLSSDADERRLLEFLQRARNLLGRPFYDPKYALRLVKERGRPRACVKLLCELGLFEDAVDLALAVDLDLAKAVASGPEDDDTLRRKLWLGIAKHVVQQGQENGGDQAAHIKQAVDFLKEAGGLLKIEDILPFFPDFVTIDNFKAAICDSLQRYNRQIEELKKEMDEATEIAEAVRRDLKLLSCRTATLSTRETCAKCGRPVADAPPNKSNLPTGGAIPPFYLFPTGLVFHVVCASEEVLHLGGPSRAQRVKTLLQRLSRAAPGATTAPGYNGYSDEPVSNLLSMLEEEVGLEDPWNGEVTVRQIDMPFISHDEDVLEVASWRI
eukprot:jgi/Chrzof1/3163/Cz12g14060.t1